VVTDPNFSWDPRYIPNIFVGVGTLAIAVYGLVHYGEKTDKKTDTKETYPFWHFVSVGVATYVLLYWLLYWSLIASLVGGFGIAIGTMLAVYHERDLISKNYPRWKGGVYIFLFLAVAGPFIIFKDAGVPHVNVSPQSPYVSMNQGQNNNQTATVKSVRAQAYDLNLTAQAPQAKGLISVFINDTLGGPFPIHFLPVDQQKIIVIRIVSGKLQNGTYPVQLNYSYTDSLNSLNRKTYFDSRVILVSIGTSAPASIGLPPYTPQIIGVVLISVFAVREFIVRVRPRDKGGLRGDTPKPPGVRYGRLRRFCGPSSMSCYPKD